MRKRLARAASTGARRIRLLVTERSLRRVARIGAEAGSRCDVLFERRRAESSASLPRVVKAVVSGPPHVAGRAVQVAALLCRDVADEFDRRSVLRAGGLLSLGAVLAACTGTSTRTAGTTSRSAA